MKARLWKGPFSGKVIEHDGSHEIIVTGPKRMTRKQRYEYEVQTMRDPYYHPGAKPYPMVRARYRICTKPVPNAAVLAKPDPFSPISYAGYAVMQMCHPDGSVFYEFVDKREY